MESCVLRDQPASLQPMEQHAEGPPVEAGLHGHPPPAPGGTSSSDGRPAAANKHCQDKAGKEPLPQPPHQPPASGLTAPNLS